METVPLREARDRLGRIYESVVEGTPAQITKRGADPIVMVSKTQYDRLVNAATYLQMAEAVVKIKTGDFSGYTAVSRAQLADDNEEWLA